MSKLESEKLTLKQLFDRQHGAINYFLEKMDMNQVQKFADLLIECFRQRSGIIFFSGVGKSGAVADSSAALLNSFGIRSMTLNPQNALHGDIGIVSSQDSVVLISKSGNTEELLTLIPYLRKKGCTVLGMSCNSKGHLAQRADFTIILPLQDETICPFKLSPTTSTTIQILFSHTLSVYLMQERGLSLHDYAHNHPSGTIGKRLSLEVRDVMKPLSECPTCLPTDTLLDVLMYISEKKAGACVVTNVEPDGSKIICGLLTDGDIRRSMVKHGPDALKQHVKDFMNPGPITVHQNSKAFDALLLMQQKKMSMIPVLDENNKLAGVVMLHMLLEVGLL
mmetsp:Transcript_6567/g.9117  ORF Transcript_6567/g.9117 Transcript_6567/m.9117 type:complete len:336 (-) Transcript_6567:38-1045(-)